MGSFAGTVDFDPGVANTNTVASGSLDNIFISRYSSVGSFINIFIISSNGQVQAEEITTDNAGAIYICGRFTSSFDIDPGPQTYLLNGTSYFKSFLVKFSSAGALHWVKTFDDGIDSRFTEISIDKVGQVNVLGGFQGSSMDFDPSTNNQIITNPGTDVNFLATYDTAGNYINVWYYRNYLSTYAAFSAITYLSDSSLIILGAANGVMDIDPTSNVNNSPGYNSQFLLRIQFGTSTWCSIMPVYSGYGPIAVMAADLLDNIIIAGSFDGLIDMDPSNATDTINADQGAYDVFIASYNPAGDLNWVRAVGSEGHDELTGVALDQSDNIYVTGVYDGTMDFDPGVGTAIESSAGVSRDPFIAVYSSSGAYQQHFTFGTSNNVEEGINVCATTSGMIFTGAIRGTIDYQPGSGTTLLGDMYSEAYIVAYDFVLGMPSLTFNNAAIYPNPMHEYATISLSDHVENASVEVINSSGQILRKAYFSGYQYTLYKNDLPGGLYVLRIASDVETIIARLVIE